MQGERERERERDKEAFSTAVFLARRALGEEKDTHEEERAAPEERRRWLMFEIKEGSVIERGR